MKQITIISGKGGTGKTTITASLAALAHNPAGAIYSKYYRRKFRMRK